jgi:prepilin-type N-terminal cleavage/methylation domain-containing protein
MSRLRRQEGFGLVELLIAMTVLSVGIFAVVAGFSSGYVALARATRVSSSSVLADAQMERFRALTYPWICLSTGSSESTYTAAAPSGTVVPSCSSTDPTLVPIQGAKTGPDNRTYRIDTYVVWNCPIGGTLSTSSPDTTSAPGCRAGSTLVSRPVKLVRVVVRDGAPTLTSKVYVQEESTFDERSGS